MHAFHVKYDQHALENCSYACYVTMSIQNTLSIELLKLLES